MTREEAINIIKSECYVFNPLNFDKSTMVNTALDMAIEALEQEPAEIHKCDVRVNIEGDYYMIIEVQKENSKIMHIDGSFEWLDNYNIITDETTEMTMEEFLEIVMKNK